MKKNELKVPALWERFKNLVKLCMLIFLISSVTANLNSLRAQQSQSREISGIVTDSQGQPIPAVSVVVKGTTIGKSTDIDGKFQLTVPVDAQALVFTFIGMKTQEVNIIGLSDVSVQMVDETVGLEEVVVVGYGTQKKVTVTGAVASVGNVQLVQTPVANVSTMLTGRSPGLLTVQRTGEPGEDKTTIRIRGASTFAGSQEPLILLDGIETDNYNNIDPNEIESIAILKDASATAVYGVRGANGVLIITTKRGKEGRLQVNFSTNFAVNQFTELRGRMRAYDYTWGWNEALKYDSYITGVYVPRFTDSDIQHWKDKDDPIYHPDIDWVDLMFKEVATQNQQNLNIRGGTEKVKYFVSIGRFGQEGVEQNTDLQPDFFDYKTVFNRYNFRSNFDFTLTKRFTVTVNLSNQIEQKNGMNANDLSSWMRSISLASSIATPGIIDKKILYLQTPYALNGTPLSNMYLGSGYMKRYKNFLDGTLRFNYDLDLLTKGLSAHFTVSFQNFNRHTLTFTKQCVTYNVLDAKGADGSPIIVSNADDGPYGQGQSVDKYRQNYAEAGFDYSRTFGNHNITGLLLYNQTKRFDPDLQYLVPTGYQGLVGRLAYNYMGRYLAEFNAGYNGTENFAPGNRFGFFPAYSLGWVPSEESFFPKNDILTFLKFRASYGEVGNDKIGGDRFLYSPSSYVYYSGSYYYGMVGISSSSYTGSYEGKIGNPDITWERAKKTDIGVEFNLFKDRIKFSVDYFNERRDNILTLKSTIPATLGVGNNLPASNIGQMKNSGFDGEVSINLNAGKFNYWIKANYTYAHNEILFKDEVYNPYSYLYTTGQRYGQIYGPVEVENLYNSWMEVNDSYRPLDTYQNNRLQPGDIHWKDINGDGLYDQYDRGPVGYSNFPEKTFGVSLGGDYKGFDFSVMFQGSSNVSFDGQDKYIIGWNNNQQTADFLINSWSQERYEAGLPIYFPHYNFAGSNSKVDAQIGSYFIVDASYIRLRNAEIGYSFNRNSFFSSIGISSLRIYVNGSNLFVYAPQMRKKYPNVDPEFTSTYYGSTTNEPYPKTRTINFGININF